MSLSVIAVMSAWILIGASSSWKTSAIFRRSCPCWNDPSTALTTKAFTIMGAWPIAKFTDCRLSSLRKYSLRMAFLYNDRLQPAILQIRSIDLARCSGLSITSNRAVSFAEKCSGNIVPLLKPAAARMSVSSWCPTTTDVDKHSRKGHGNIWKNTW